MVLVYGKIWVSNFVADKTWNFLERVYLSTIYDKMDLEHLHGCSYKNNCVCVYVCVPYDYFWESWPVCNKGTLSGEVMGTSPWCAHIAALSVTQSMKLGWWKDQVSQAMFLTLHPDWSSLIDTVYQSSLNIFFRIQSLQRHIAYNLKMLW